MGRGNSHQFVVEINFRVSQVVPNCPSDASYARRFHLTWLDYSGWRRSGGEFDGASYVLRGLEYLPNSQLPEKRNQLHKPIQRSLSSPKALIEKSTKNQVLFLNQAYYSLKSVFGVKRQHFFLVKYNLKGQHLLQVRYVHVPFSHVCDVLHVLAIFYGYNS
ncbi:hypothetical protein MTR67_031420 [Solanum verrucosum]|uniref:Uncharacterized protein n=1 Tax=Solanum verrucosum TaxID=315347 RepID=A0AAF0U2E4_SOLVR|nr:hypothetical protein MTR67_031420 [Solanum verrucosum]